MAKKTTRQRKPRPSSPSERRWKLPQPLVDTATEAIDLMRKHWPPNVPRAVAWITALNRIGLDLGQEYAQSRVSTACEDRISSGIAACLNAEEDLSIEEFTLVCSLVISARRAELRARALEHEVVKMVFDLGLAVLKNDTARLERDARKRHTLVTTDHATK